MKRTLTIPEAAERLGVSRRSVYIYISAGKLQTEPARHRTLRIVATSLDTLLYERQVEREVRAAGKVSRAEAAV